MRYLLLLVFVLVLALTGCEMPGAGQVTEQVETQFNSIKEQVEGLTVENEDLAEQIDAIQEQLDLGGIEMPDLSDIDINGITEQLEDLSLQTDSLLQNFSVGNDSLISQVNDLLETQVLVIDSLKTKINNLEGEIASLRNTVTNMNNGTGRTEGSSSGRGGTSSGSGRGGTTGGSTGGTTGGRV